MFSKYYELGLAVIPILPRSKVPPKEAAGFDDWALHGNPIEKIEEFEEKYPTSQGYGVAVLCGPASNVAVIDVDTMDPAILAALPLSPVIRRGRDGRMGALFMRYNPEIANQKFVRQLNDKEELRVDILCDRKYIVVPPSVHESGKRYQWVTPDTLENFDVKDLPLLMPEHLDAIAAAIGVNFETSSSQPVNLKGVYDSPDGFRCAHGAHDRLKALSAALISKRTSIHEAVIELINYDKDHHLRVPYFKDHRRGSDFGADPYSNAARFYCSIMKTVNMGRMRKGELVEIPFEAMAKQEMPMTIGPVQPQAFVPLELPRPKGLLNDIMELTFKLSKRKQPATALATAVSVCSVLAANKFKIDSVWPNVYCLVVAGTGSGKGFASEVAKRLLAVEVDTDLLGQGTPMSGQAFIKDFGRRRERLDIMDECSDLFNLMTSGGVFQQNLMDIMNTVWAESNSIYIGPATKGEESIRIFHPCISILMLTNEDGFKSTVTKNFISKGFIPRMLPFVDWEYGEVNEEMSWDETLLAKVVAKISDFQERKVEMDQNNKNLMCPKPKPRAIHMTPSARTRLKEFDKTMNALVESKTVSETRKQLSTRALQQVMKLSLIHGVFNQSVVDLEDVEWACATFEALNHNAMPLFESVSATTAIEAAVVGVLNIIRRSGSISIAKLYEQTRHLTKSLRSEALEALKIEGKIALASDAHGQSYIAL